MSTNDAPPHLAPTVDPYSAEELANLEAHEFPSLSAQRLEVTEPLILAQYLERLETAESRAILRLLSIEKASEVLSEMDSTEAAEVFSEMREHRAVQILEELNPDDAADVVAELDQDDRLRLLGKLEPETAEDIRTLLAYDPETAGGLMTPLVPKATESMTVDEAIAGIRASSDELEDCYHIYITDNAGRLRGAVSIRRMLLARPGQKMRDLMSGPLQGLCTPETDREEVARRMADLNLPELAVVDPQGFLLGVVTHDDVIDVLREEATEDLQKILGASGDESIHDELVESVRRRNPWLMVNLTTSFMAGGVVFLFHHQIEQLALLAVFMPIVASTGGNCGNQTLAVAIRALALGQVQDSDRRQILLRQGTLGLVNGVAIGAVAAIIAGLWTGRPGIGAVVFAAMVLNMGLAGIAGAFIPLFLKRMKFDPAQSSSIFLTALTDIAGFFIFLSLGTWLLL